ncbi:MAG: hypothetical protein M3292_03190, partial [Actinomycetota bacterium]|nr:hypothetical protein [Actinomycetota bacterium]
VDGGAGGGAGAVVADVVAVARPSRVFVRQPASSSSLTICAAVRSVMPDGLGDVPKTSGRIGGDALKDMGVGWLRTRKVDLSL